MDNSPERRAQPPTPELRASDADRDRYVNVLRDALAEGRLTTDEHAERVDAALAARTLRQLEPLIADLPTPGPIGYEPAAANTVPPHPARSNMFAFWSSSTRKGRWRAGSKLNAVAVMGGVDIDLTDAVFDEPELVINVFAFWGGIDIRIPEGVTVRDHGFGFMGGFDVHEQYTDDPHAPVVVVKGLAIMGGVMVKAKRRKEQRRRALDGEPRPGDTGDRFREYPEEPAPDRFRKDSD
ncbi:DUF1707 SHOCT-like domain-containing protein [Embleya scabrispora]|uniref:DUF1707 SHOCT-like domain-containing protein n=1 Tax=Embleya scabrispora TaxID=159449 RepID=UPI00039A97E2|nr:DUF1707 domain-containing protein [Embleya scabrispora]MYS83342.1 DUF1707 domain-containing protein [Streptomyces sp. SID5474]